LPRFAGSAVEFSMKSWVAKVGLLLTVGIGVSVVVVRSRRPAYVAGEGAVEQALRDAGYNADSLALAQACKVAADGCRCDELAAQAALDADLAKPALLVAEHALRACPGKGILTGERAEALARDEKSDEAARTADAALALEPKNGFAKLALARVAFHRSQMTNCHDYAKSALELGRGPEAERWLGRALLAKGVFAGAKPHFEHLLAARPRDLEATFSIGICADHLGRFRDAREAFLRTLQINPKHRQAREHLFAMTFRAGALDEARHHLDKLAEIVPADDAQLAQFRETLAAGPKGAGTPGGAASAPAPGVGVVTGQH
jgi:tetratricopeptide (TPR) repeat protein